MRNDQLPNINPIANGSRVRMEVAFFLTYMQQYCSDVEKAQARAFFAACSAAIPAPEPEE